MTKEDRKKPFRTESLSKIAESFWVWQLSKRQEDSAVVVSAYSAEQC